MSAGKPIVVYLQRSLDGSSETIGAYLSQLVGERGWVLKTEYYAAALPRDQDVKFGGKIGKTVRALVESLRPIGFVVEYSSMRPIPAESFGGVPVVYVDVTREVRSRQVACVTCDNEAITRAAADELLPLGYPHAAYARWFTRPIWSVERESAFRRIVREQGLSFAALDCPKPEHDRLSAVARQIAALPKPCAVFAVNDFIARYVLDACTKLGLSVPEDIAVIGVDNSTQICEHLQTTLSSVAINYRREASAACELLDRMLNGEKGGELSFGSAGVIRRASTRLLRRKDATVVKATEFIRLNYSKRIGVADAAAAVGVSAATLQRRFDLAVGHGVGEEIADVRFAAAQRLLRSPGCAVSAVANLCGYDSDSTLRYAFKSRLGVSPRAYSLGRDEL